MEFAEKVLTEENKPLSQNEIWEIGRSKGYDKYVNSTGKTPWQTIGARLYVDIRDNLETKFIKLKLKPTKFFLKSLSEKVDIRKIESEIERTEVKKESQFKERALHKYLSYYVYTYEFIYTKTIFHEESTKKNIRNGFIRILSEFIFPLNSGSLKFWIYPRISEVRE